MIHPSWPIYISASVHTPLEPCLTGTPFLPAPGIYAPLTESRRMVQILKSRDSRPFRKRHPQKPPSQQTPARKRKRKKRHRAPPRIQTCSRLAMPCRPIPCNVIPCPTDSAQNTRNKDRPFKKKTRKKNTSPDKAI